MRNAEKKRGSRIEDRDCSDIFLAYAYSRLSPASRLVPRASFLDPRPFHFAILVSPPFLRRHPRQLQRACLWVNSETAASRLSSLRGLQMLAQFQQRRIIGRYRRLYAFFPQRVC